MGRRTWASPRHVAGAVVAAGMLGVGFAPLFGGPGYEQALATGVVVPTAAAVAVALELSREWAPAPVECVGRGVWVGLCLAAMSFATALVHGLRVGMCDLSGGSVYFCLAALPGCLLGGVWGAVVAEVARGRRRRVLVAILGSVALPLASILVSVWRFYSSPMIFAFDPFFGYFSGVLYDTVIDAGTPLLTYRLGSLATLVGVALLASALVRDTRGRLRLPAGLRLDPGGLARMSLAVLALGASAAVTLAGPALGHYQTSETIARALGGSASGDRCDVVFPAGMLASESRLLVKDCEEELSAMDRALGATGPSRVRVFVFRDAGEKKRLMGAADTLIAKPWRREVYVQRAAYPHPVLGHELAHVVAGTFGRGPFRVAGALWGLAFDPGLVEGVAVAASPDDDNLSEAQWVHALLEMDALPPVRDLFSHAFFTMAASKSYVIAGAFVRFVQERYGNGVLRSWYGGASIEALTGEDWASLDRRFRESLVRTPLSAEAQSFARARFERPSVFGRKCPHVIDAVRGEADRCRGRNEYARATELYGEVLGRDPHDWSARYGLGMVSARQRDWAAGERELRALIDSEQAPRTLRDWARDALADADLLRGDDEKARVAYRELAARSLDEDFARTEEVKEAAAGDPAGRATVLALLVGGVDRPPDTVVAAERAGEWEGRTASPLAGYLVGRTMLNLGWYADAAPHLDRAIDAGAALPPRVAREAVRLRSVAACALGDRRAALRLRLVVAAPDGPFAPSEGRRLATLRLLDRCSFSSPPEP